MVKGLPEIPPVLEKTKFNIFLAFRLDSVRQLHPKSKCGSVSKSSKLMVPLVKSFWVQKSPASKYEKLAYTNQCSGAGFTCFWASRIRIHQSETWIRIRILLSQGKNSKKKLNYYCLVTSFGLFISENDVNVPSTSNKQKFFQNQFFVGALKVNDEDSRILIRIRTRIHQSETQISGSRSGSTPKSGTLL